MNTACVLVNSNNSGDNNGGSSAPRGGGLERGAVENSGRLVADLLEDAADGAISFRHAFLAGRIGGLADARDEGERSVQRADDLADADLVGGAAQLVAAAGPLAAVDEAAVLEGEEDVLEELLRDRFLLGKVADEHGSAAMGVVLCKRNHRFQAVFPLARQHFSLQTLLT